MKERQSFSLQWDKLAAAVAYLAERSRMPPRFGETKLLILLYYVDCANYVRTLQPVTGTTYVRGKRAPYPKGWHSIRQELEDRGLIRIIERERKRESTRYVVKSIAAVNTAKAAAVSEPERALVDEQLARFAGFDANRMLKYLNKEIAWRTTKPGDSIPYELSGIRIPPPPTDEMRERARRIAEEISKHGRQVSRVLVERRDAI